MRRALPLILTCACAAPPAPPDRGVGVYSERLDFAAVERAVPDLARSGLDLYQVLEPRHIGDPALASLIAACDRQGVGVRAWLVLPREQGLWPNEDNLQPFGQALSDLLAWIERDRLRVSHITFDLEPAWDYTQALLGKASNEGMPRDYVALVNLFRSHRDPARFAESQAVVRQMVDQVHRAGLRAHAVTYPMVVDDAGDDDTDLQDALDIPVTGAPWDEVSLMVYRSTWQGFAAGELSPDLLYSYGRDARLRFGEQAGIDLGVVGQDPITAAPGYVDPQVLAADVGAARAAGIERLHLYSLETAQGRPDALVWLDFARTPAAAPPSEDRDVKSFRALFATLDAILQAPP